MPLSLLVVWTVDGQMHQDVQTLGRQYRGGSPRTGLRQDRASGEWFCLVGRAESQVIVPAGAQLVTVTVRAGETEVGPPMHVVVE